MNFRTISQLNEHIVAGLAQVPHEVDLVVGVPRSGLLAGAILALNLNVALTDVTGLLEGRLLEAGSSRRSGQRIAQVSYAKTILVIDDSCLSGKEMGSVRARIEAAGLKARIFYSAVYVTEESAKLVDIFFDICPMPRVFEWNVMHHPLLINACVDIDGVLCVDPTDEENDDGENYRRFLDEATPLWLPTLPVGTLVTSRLEKYRVKTENWLKRNGVQYKELVMLNMASAEERRKSGCHGRFKGEVFRRSPAELFIESNPGQAREIAELGSKPVFCTADRQMYFPSTMSMVGLVMRKLPAKAPSLGWRMVTGLKKRWSTWMK